MSVSTADDGRLYCGVNRRRSRWANYSGGNDAYISKFDSDGSKQWTQLLGTNELTMQARQHCDDGFVYIAGTTVGDLDGQTNNGLADAFISKFDSDGSSSGQNSRNK